MDDASLPPWATGLNLQPHPEGGWYAETWRSGRELPAEVLPEEYGGARPLATSIVFLLLPGESSAWHVVRSDELWIHQRGGPLVLGLGGRGPRAPGAPFERILGTDSSRGESPQLLVPAGTWQTARPAGPEPVLVACVVAPGFDYADWRLASDPAPGSDPGERRRPGQVHVDLTGPSANQL